MKETLKFYRCKSCGGILELICGKNPCGSPESLEELTPNTVDAAQEKHLPVVTHTDGTVEVNVGEVPHPMEDEHLIEWVCVETDKGTHRRYLCPGDGLTMTFDLNNETPTAVYAYCNLHGLWKTDVK